MTAPPSRLMTVDGSELSSSHRVLDEMLLRPDLGLSEVLVAFGSAIQFDILEEKCEGVKVKARLDLVGASIGYR